MPWSTISVLKYSEIMKKGFENIYKKIKHEDKYFLSQQRYWENIEQNNESIIYREEITLVYKSEHNSERENKVLLLMINDDDDYYFAVKSKLELCLSEWLRSKKESIINEDDCFQNALNGSLDYQRIKIDLQKISKLKSYIN